MGEKKQNHHQQNNQSKELQQQNLKNPTKLTNHKNPNQNYSPPITFLYCGLRNTDQV